MDKPENSEFSSDFERIQPLCANLVRDFSLENMTKLEQALNEVNSRFINAFQEYLLFPFRLSLMKTENENELIKSLEIATSIFDRSELNSWPLFSNTVTTAFQRISDPQHIDKVSDSSEELKLSVCQCVSSMVKNSNENIRQCMYKGSFSLPLAHIFHTLVVLLQHERSKSLRRAILQTIGLLTYSRDFIPSRNVKTEELASKSLAFYLPGLSMGLASVVCGDNKQGESVIRMALKLLADLIVITVNDCCAVTKDSDVPIKASNEDKVFVTKNAKWFQDVASKFCILIQNTTVLVTHDHRKVRQDYLYFAESILLDCTRNLENCVPVLLPAVFALSVDSHEDISLCGQKLIERFSNKFQAMNSFTLCSIIEDELYTSASKLIKCKLGASDDQKLFILRSMHGCLQILGSSVDKILFSASHLEKLMLSLLNLLEFESSLLMVEEISVNLDISSMNIMPRKRFCYFEKKEILDTIFNICCCLGKSKYNRLVIDYLIENMHTSEIFLLQSIFLIGCIVGGLSNDSLDINQNIDLIGDVLEEILSPSLVDVPLHRTDFRAITYNEQSSSVQVYNDNNIYQVCLILEAVEKCAKILGESFRVFLIKVLFNVMEKAGNSNYIVSQAGKICLYGIAQFCGYNPRVELVRDNADYLVNSIILNYHHFLYKPEMSAVLHVVLQESDGEMLPLFKDCIQRLLKMLDCNQERAFPILTVLKSVVIFVKKWFPTEKLQDSGLSTPAADNFSDLKAYFLKKNKKTSTEDRESSMEKPSVKDSEVVDDEENSTQEKVPLHADLVSQILKQCSHFQSARNLQLRVLALEVMELSILALSDFEREQHPLVHQLWNSFVRRFSEENIIVLQAFKVLLVIADECRDFVRARCLKDIGPKLISLLKNHFSSSLIKNYIKSYQWSNDCKLQLCVLSEIGSLFVKLDVTEKDIAQLAEVCLPYLQKSQPKVFREAAFKTLKALSVIDPDAIWYYFNCQYSEEQQLRPPHEKLQPVHFLMACATDPQFKIDC